MKIICIGKNYAAHALEFGGGVPPEPIFFCKPDTALLRNNEPFYVPGFSSNVHYECEVVVRIERVAKAIDERFAHRCYNEIGLGIDFTARDIQMQCAEQGLPWEKAKAFDHSAAVSPRFLPFTGDTEFEMYLNDELRQRASTREMTFGIDRLISYVSRFMTLKIGDLLFTGTPAGVGPVSPGDHITAAMNGEVLLDFDVK